MAERETLVTLANGYIWREARGEGPHRGLPRPGRRIVRTG